MDIIFKQQNYVLFHLITTAKFCAMNSNATTSAQSILSISTLSPESKKTFFKLSHPKAVKNLCKAKKMQIKL